MRCLRICLIILCCTLSPVLAWADGTQFNGPVCTISWDSNTELDLNGYRLYDRVSLAVVPTPIQTVGRQVTSVTCASLGLNAGQHYISISALDTSGNESVRSNDIAFVIIVVNQISNLAVTIINATDMTLSFTEVDDGVGSPAKYDVRLATPTIDNWGTAVSVTSGTCSTPVAGTTIGATKTCTVTGLPVTTPYQFQLVPYRGTLGVDAVFGPLSNIAAGTTGGSPPPATTRITLFSDGFTRANDPLGLGAFWDSGYFDNAYSKTVYPLQIVTDASRGTVASYNNNVQTVNATGVIMPNAQWAEATIKTITGGDGVYGWVALRASAPPNYTMYQAVVARNDGTFRTKIERKINGGVVSLITENATTWAALDVVRFEAVWNDLTNTNDLRVYRNDALLLSTTDASLVSGRVGLGTNVQSTVANMEFEQFSAGGFTTTVETCGCDQH